MSHLSGPTSQYSNGTHELRQNWFWPEWSWSWIRAAQFSRVVAGGNIRHLCYFVLQLEKSARESSRNLPEPVIFGRQEQTNGKRPRSQLELFLMWAVFSYKVGAINMAVFDSSLPLLLRLIPEAWDENSFPSFPNKGVKTVFTQIFNILWTFRDHRLWFLIGMVHLSLGTSEGNFSFSQAQEIWSLSVKKLEVDNSCVWAQEL